MKWYIWAAIAVGVGTIGFFGYKMFIQKEDKGVATNDGSGAQTPPVQEDASETRLSKVA